MSLDGLKLKIYVSVFQFNLCAKNVKNKRRICINVRLKKFWGAIFEIFSLADT